MDFGKKQTNNNGSEKVEEAKSDPHSVGPLAATWHNYVELGNMKQKMFCSGNIDRLESDVNKFTSNNRIRVWATQTAGANDKIVVVVFYSDESCVVNKDV